MQDFHQKPVPENIQEQVTALGSVMGTVPSGKTLQGQVNTLVSNLSLLDSNINSTNDILASAVQAQKTSFFFGSGSGYTGTVPSGNYRYGVFIVFLRSTNRYVLAFSTDRAIALNFYNGSTWEGWKELAQNQDLVQRVSVAITFTNGLGKLQKTNLNGTPIAAYDASGYTYTISGDSTDWLFTGFYFTGSGTATFVGNGQKTIVISYHKNNEILS